MPEEEDKKCTTWEGHSCWSECPEHGVLKDEGARKPRGPNLSPLEKAQKNPKSLRAAIDAKCYDCQGGGEDPSTWERVRRCPISDCGLYLLRRK